MPFKGLYRQQQAKQSLILELKQELSLILQKDTICALKSSAVHDE